MGEKTLVLGASLKTNRYSNMAIRRLVDANEEVAEVTIKTGKPNFKGVDTVTLYLNPKRQKEYYDYILSLRPKRAIFNPGTENMELVRLLQKNNIISEIACTLVLLSTGQY